MKKLYKYIVLFIGIVAFCACTDENDFLNVVEEGNDVTLKLSVQTQANKNIVVSRATAEENKLYDLHFYVFNERGDLTGYKELVSETGNILTPGPEEVEITTKTGKSYIYAVANINQGDTYYLNSEDLSLLNVTDVETSELTREKLLDINFQRLYGSESEWFSPTPQFGKYVMSGYLNDGNQVTILQNEENLASIADENGNIIEEPIIQLYRILAKNTLTISWNNKFTPKYYKLCNVPTSGMLMPNAGINTVYNKDNERYLTLENVDAVKDIEVVSNYRKNISLSSDASNKKSLEIIFHYPENLRSYGANQNIEKWQDREKNTWDFEGTVKTFDYAADKASYIEFYGDYIDDNNNITANVSYTIHLGNFSNTGSLSDFNVIRNHNYKYTVNINGINDIKAEAELENDNPYAEGLVINAKDGKHYEVDAHYEARIMEFTKASMEALKEYNGAGYIVNISTPFGNTSQTLMVKQITKNGIPTAQICNLQGEELATLDSEGNLIVEADKTVFSGEADYKWMKFVKNTDSNKPDYATASDPISKYPCKYPGDDNQNGRWLNVFELLAELYNTDDNSVYSASGYVYYTCFIDEYYYKDKTWPEYVNKPRRTMQIANNLDISSDGKSIYAEVEYSISQRSISTFYTNANRPNIVAFGTENIDEEDIYDNKNPMDLDIDDGIKTRLGNNNSSEYYQYFENLEINNAHNWNGRSNTVSVFQKSNRPWYVGENKISIINKEGVQPMYRAAAKACMSRNRDLNGNTYIDTDEVKWYLASVDQYRALFFGQSVLEEDVRLFGSQQDLSELNSLSRNYHFEQRGKYHYWTSSGKAAGTFWPEEGMTDNIAGNPGWGVCRAELVRCVRTLQSGGDGLMNPEEYFTFTPADNEKNVEFKLDAMTVTRVPSNDPLPNHTEVTLPWNDFTIRFAVAKDDLQDKNDRNRVDRWSSNDAKGDDPCLNHSEGGYKWRMPNQKEFALMLTRMDELGMSTSYYYLMRTNYSMGWHPSNYGIFGYDAGSINLTDHSNRARIRCVRDIGTTTNVQ